jgi:hypothetical protein
VTPIHDHVTWCVFGVIEGLEWEELFELDAGGVGEPRSRRAARPMRRRIVAEVLIGILEADRGSYRANEPSWTPTMPTGRQRFGLTRCFQRRIARRG